MSSAKYRLTWIAYCCYGSRMKRRKPKGERKETSVRIRLTDEQKAALTKTATKAGLDLSGWLRSVALRESGRAS